MLIQFYVLKSEPRVLAGQYFKAIAFGGIAEKYLVGIKLARSFTGISSNSQCDFHDHYWLRKPLSFLYFPF